MVSAITWGLHYSVYFCSFLMNISHNWINIKLAGFASRAVEIAWNDVHWNPCFVMHDRPDKNSNEKFSI